MLSSFKLREIAFNVQNDVAKCVFLLCKWNLVKIFNATPLNNVWFTVHLQIYGTIYCSTFVVYKTVSLYAWAVTLIFQVPFIILELNEGGYVWYFQKLLSFQIDLLQVNIANSMVKLKIKQLGMRLKRHKKTQTFL